MAYTRRIRMGTHAGERLEYGTIICVEVVWWRSVAPVKFRRLAETATPQVEGEMVILQIRKLRSATAAKIAATAASVMQRTQATKLGTTTIGTRRDAIKIVTIPGVCASFPGRCLTMSDGPVMRPAEKKDNLPASEAENFVRPVPYAE